MMKTSIGILFSLVTLALLGCVGIAAAAPADSSGTQAGSVDTIAPYNGPIGPGNSLYGLKIAFENLDEAFTFNQSEKLEKQVSHADLRLAELKRELADNRTHVAEIALEQYRQKINQTEDTLAPFSHGDGGNMQAGNETGLSHAREMIAKHQQVLEDLRMSHPDNTGLAHAYNNSVALEQKFAKKMETRSHQNADNSTFVPRQNMTAPNTGGWSDNNGNRTLPQNGNQSWNRNGPADNWTGNFPRNMTAPNTGGWFDNEGNRTLPQNGNQSWNRNGPADNWTGNFPRNMNQTMDRNSNDPHGQTINQTVQGQPQKPGNTAPGNSQNQNNNDNSGNNQNINKNANPDTDNRNNNTNGNAANGGNKPNNNANTNAGTRNSNTNGNTGATNSGNTNGNTRFTGR